MGPVALKPAHGRSSNHVVTDNGSLNSCLRARKQDNSTLPSPSRQRRGWGCRFFGDAKGLGSPVGGGETASSPPDPKDPEIQFYANSDSGPMVTATIIAPAQKNLPGWDVSVFPLDTSGNGRPPELEVTVCSGLSAFVSTFVYRNVLYTRRRRWCCGSAEFGDLA